MFNTTTTRLSITPPTIAHLRWGWDSNPWVPLLLHYLLQPHMHNLPIFSLRLTKPLDSLSGFNRYARKSIRFCRNPMLSTRSAMINTGYCTSFRLETKSGYICRRSISQSLIRSSTNIAMGLTPSPRMWVEMLLSSTLHPSLACT